MGTRYFFQGTIPIVQLFFFHGLISINRKFSEFSVWKLPKILATRQGNKSCLYIYFVLKCDFWLWTGIQPNVHTAGGMHLPVYIVDCGAGDTLTATPASCGKEYTLTSTLLTVERNAPSRLHCWLWKGSHPHGHTLWWWKGMHPHVYTVDCGKECTLTSTLLTVERDTASRPHPLVVERNAPSRLLYTVDCGKGYSLTSTLLVVERDKPSLYIVDCALFTSTPWCWWKGINPHYTLLTVHSSRPHPDVGGKGYTLTSTVLVVENVRAF